MQLTGDAGPLLRDGQPRGLLLVQHGGRRALAPLPHEAAEQPRAAED